jgi:hypothetical protein
MARPPRLTERGPGNEDPQPAPAVDAARPKPVAAGHRRAAKPASALWADALGRVGIRSAQVLLILAVAVVSVYALMQIKLLVIPVLIALILAAAIGPFVNMLRSRGLPGASRPESPSLGCCSCWPGFPP